MALFVPVSNAYTCGTGIVVLEAMRRSVATCDSIAAAAGGVSPSPQPVAGMRMTSCKSESSWMMCTRLYEPEMRSTRRPDEGVVLENVGANLHCELDEGRFGNVQKGPESLSI